MSGIEKYEGNSIEKLKEIQQSFLTLSHYLDKFPTDANRIQQGVYIAKKYSNFLENVGDHSFPTLEESFHSFSKKVQAPKLISQALAKKNVSDYFQFPDEFFHVLPASSQTDITILQKAAKKYEESRNTFSPHGVSLEHILKGNDLLEEYDRLTNEKETLTFKLRKVLFPLDIENGIYLVKNGKKAYIAKISHSEESSGKKEFSQKRKKVSLPKNTNIFLEFSIILDPLWKKEVFLAALPLYDDITNVKRVSSKKIPDGEKDENDIWCTFTINGKTTSLSERNILLVKTTKELRAIIDAKGEGTDSVQVVEIALMIKALKSGFDAVTKTEYVHPLDRLANALLLLQNAVTEMNKNLKIPPGKDEKHKKWQKQLLKVIERYAKEGTDEMISMISSVTILMPDDHIFSLIQKSKELRETYLKLLSNIYLYRLSNTNIHSIKNQEEISTQWKTRENTLKNTKTRVIEENKSLSPSIRIKKIQEKTKTMKRLSRKITLFNRKGKLLDKITASRGLLQTKIEEAQKSMENC
jgi:hypothetical protein